MAETAATASLPSIEDCEASMRKILKGANLDTLSRKMVRKQLQEEFKTDLSSMKTILNERILTIIEEMREESSSDGESSEPPPKKRAKKSNAASSSGRGGAFNNPMEISPELASVLETSSASRPQVVKLMWDYIKKHDLQDPSNKKNIILDTALSKAFQRSSFTMFSMNKYLKRHLKKPEELSAAANGWDSFARDGVSSEEDEVKVAAKKAAKAAKKKQKAASGTATKRKAPAFTQEMVLSDTLAAFVGQPTMSRPQVVKSLWDHIKTNELQNPEDKREIQCDESLTKIFGEKIVTMFSMNKFLKVHFLRKAEE